MAFNEEQMKEINETAGKLWNRSLKEAAVEAPKHEITLNLVKDEEQQDEH